MTDLGLKVSEKCIHCGQCINDCMSKVLEFDENNVPQVAKGGEERCIKCQHCMAVCPVGALSIFGKDPENSASVFERNPEELLNLIQTRRSFRHYKQENLPPEIMDKLKDMLKYTPTGVNNHRLHFSFIDDIEVMNDFRDYTNQKILDIITKEPWNILTKKYGFFKQQLINGDDVLFRNAPHLVVVSTPLDAPCRDIDPIIALSYFELYAQSLGVATLWCGLGHGCVQFLPELSKQLEIPENYKASYMMLFGPADVTYHRSTQPEECSVISVKKGNREMPFFQKAKRFLGNNVK